MVKISRRRGNSDEPIVELETDKVNAEVPAPSNGFLGSIDVQEGETVNVGSLLGTISNNTSKSTSAPKEIKNYNPPKKEPKIFDNDEIKKPALKKISKSKIQEPILKLEEESLEEEEEPLILEEVHEEKKVLKKSNLPNIETKISPAARKMASEAKNEYNEIQGTGKNGVF